MTAQLADGNVLVALVVADHVHHHVVREWFTGEQPALATCPITQGTLLRFLIREGTPAAQAMAVLGEVTSHPSHEFWPDSVAYDDTLLRGVIGHRQVTDSYLVALARHHRGVVATLDRGLASMHGSDVNLLARTG